MQRRAGAMCADGCRPRVATSAYVRAGVIPMPLTRPGQGPLTCPPDCLEIYREGRALRRRKPSAETGLHTVIYRERPGAHAILHVHTIWNTLLSGRFLERGFVPIEGYELLKGLAGVSTHEQAEQVPIVANSQDYAHLSKELGDALQGFPQAHGVLLSKHGLHTWGESVAEARASS